MQFNTKLNKWFWILILVTALVLILLWNKDAVIMVLNSLGVKQMEEEKKEKPVNKSYRGRQQNSIIILGIPVFRWRSEIYKNPDSNILLLTNRGIEKVDANNSKQKNRV